jgi:lipopolysaccharide/colanic/teichoic acid biosynthesis glycosyltransferase
VLGRYNLHREKCNVKVFTVFVSFVVMFFLAHLQLLVVTVTKVDRHSPFAFASKRMSAIPSSD